MSRSIPGGIQTEADKQYATEPYNTVAVGWSTGAVIYSDKAGAGVQAKILNLSAIATQIKFQGIGSVNTITVVLSDNDGSLKSIIDCVEMEGTSATVSQNFEGIGPGAVMMTGVVTSDIVWSEGERTLTFAIEVKITSESVGFALEEGDLTNALDTAIGQPWPHVYGTALMVQGIRVCGLERGALKAPINQASPSYPISNGKAFPQAPTVLQIEIARMIFEGTMTDETFTPTSINLPYRSNIQFAPRVLADPDEFETNVAWLAIDPDKTIDVVSMYCYADLGTGFEVNQIIGFDPATRKAIFAKSWSALAADTTGAGEINQMAISPRTAWGITYELETGSITYEVPFDTFSIRAGTPVIQYDPGVFDKYVVNLYPSSAILEVWGTRTLNGEQIFVQVPSSYYTVNLSDSLAGETPTTLEFCKSLLDYQCEGWTGDLYVSLRSTIGPNPVDVIDHLITNFTTINKNTPSFTATNPAGVAFPVGFARRTIESALALSEQVAFQTAIAMWIDQTGFVKLKYLAEVPTTDTTLDRDNTAFKTVELGFSAVEDIITRIVASWNRHYGPADFIDQGERETTFENNIDKYGIREETLDLFVYNDASLVARILQFWGYRRSNSWRRVQSEAFISELKIEAFDTIEYDVSSVITGIQGVVQNQSFDTAAPIITFETELASKAGDCDGNDDPEQDDGYWTGGGTIIDPEAPDDVGSGLGQIDYTPETDQDCIPIITIGEPFDNVREYFLVVRAWDFANRRPIRVVKRGENFGIRVQLQNKRGNRVPRDIRCDIVWIGEDGNDTLNKTKIQLTDGDYFAADAQIAGGALLKAKGIFRVSLNNETPLENRIVEAADSPVCAVVTAAAVEMDAPKKVQKKKSERKIAFDAGVGTGNVETIHDDERADRDAENTFLFEDTILDVTSFSTQIVTASIDNLVKDDSGFALIVESGGIRFADDIYIDDVADFEIIESTGGDKVHIQPGGIYTNEGGAAFSPSLGVTYDVANDNNYIYAVLLDSNGGSSSLNLEEMENLPASNDGSEGIFILVREDPIDLATDCFNQIYFLGKVQNDTNGFKIFQNQKGSIIRDIPMGFAKSDAFYPRKLYTNIADLTLFTFFVGASEWKRRNFRHPISAYSVSSTTLAGASPTDDIWVTEDQLDSPSDPPNITIDPSLEPTGFTINRWSEIFQSEPEDFQNAQKIIYTVFKSSASGSNPIDLLCLGVKHRGRIADDWTRPDGRQAGYDALDGDAEPRVEGLDFENTQDDQKGKLQDLQAFKRIVTDSDVGNWDGDQIIMVYEYSETGVTKKDYCRIDAVNHEDSKWDTFASIECIELGSGNPTLQLYDIIDPTNIPVLTPSSTGTDCPTEPFLIATRNCVSRHLEWGRLEVPCNEITWSDDCVPCSAINFTTGCIPSDSIDYDTSSANTIPCTAIDWTTCPDDTIPCEKIDFTNCAGGGTVPCANITWVDDCVPCSAVNFTTDCIPLDSVDLSAGVDCTDINFTADCVPCSAVDFGVSGCIPCTAVEFDSPNGDGCIPCTAIDFASYADCVPCTSIDFNSYNNCIPCTALDFTSPTYDDCIPCSAINFTSECIPCESIDWDSISNCIPCSAIDYTSPTYDDCIPCSAINFVTDCIPCDSIEFISDCIPCSAIDWDNCPVDEIPCDKISWTVSDCVPCSSIDWNDTSCANTIPCTAINFSTVCVPCDSIDFSACTGAPIPCTAIDWTDPSCPGSVPCEVIDWTGTSCNDIIPCSAIDFTQECIPCDAIDWANPLVASACDNSIPCSAIDFTTSPCGSTFTSTDGVIWEVGLFQNVGGWAEIEFRAQAPGGGAVKTWRTFGREV